MSYRVIERAPAYRDRKAPPPGKAAALEYSVSWLSLGRTGVIAVAPRFTNSIAGIMNAKLAVTLLRQRTTS